MFWAETFLTDGVVTPSKYYCMFECHQGFTILYVEGLGLGILRRMFDEVEASLIGAANIVKEWHASSIDATIAKLTRIVAIVCIVVGVIAVWHRWCGIIAAVSSGWCSWDHHAHSCMYRLKQHSWVLTVTKILH